MKQRTFNHTTAYTRGQQLLERIPTVTDFEAVHGDVQEMKVAVLRIQVTA